MAAARKKNKVLDDYTAYWQRLGTRSPFRLGQPLSKAQGDRAYQIASHKTHFPEMLTWARRCIDKGLVYEPAWPRHHDREWSNAVMKNFWRNNYHVLFDFTIEDYMKAGVSPEFLAAACHHLSAHPDIDALMCLQNVMMQIRYHHTRAHRNILTGRKEYAFTDDYLPFFGDAGFFPDYPAYDQPLPSAASHLPVSWIGERGKTELVLVARVSSGTSLAIEPVGG